MDEWMDGWMEELMNVRMDDWKNKWINMEDGAAMEKNVGLKLEEHIDGYTNEWMNWYGLKFVWMNR